MTGTVLPLTNDAGHGSAFGLVEPAGLGWTGWPWLNRRGRVRIRGGKRARGASAARWAAGGRVGGSVGGRRARRRLGG